MNARRRMTCHINPGAGEESLSDQTQEERKEKQESPTMIKEMLVTTCHMVGGAGDETALA